MHILIVEDEIPAFEKLRGILAIQLSGAFTYDLARSVQDAKQLLESTSDYALIFSDVRLLDGTAFELFDTVKINIPVIFCSAYDEYLFKAFKSNGIEYVLKPYTADDIANALKKYDTLFSKNHSLSSQVIDALKHSFQKRKEDIHKKQFVIKTPKGIHIVDTKNIALIEAKGDFCKIVEASGKVHLYSQNLGGIYLQLNPRQFFRINRSHVVHLPFIEKIEHHFKNRLIVTIKGATDTLMTSSASTADFRAWLDR